MASLYPRGQSWYVAFRSCGRNVKICLGQITKKQAMSCQAHIERLVACKIDGSAPPQQTSEWLAGLSTKLRGRLARADLAEDAEPTRRVPTVDQLITMFCDRKYPNYRQSTIGAHELTWRSLRTVFGSERPIDKVTPGHACDFRDTLLAQGLAEATVRKRCSVASKLFRYAVKHELIANDPFLAGEVPRANIATERNVFIDRKTALVIIDELHGTEWKLAFALMRFGGLRPGELREAMLDDIDIARGRLAVHSPKTDHIVGRSMREIPLWPEIRTLLQDRYDEAEPGEVWLLPSLRGHQTAYYRRPIIAAAKRAGVSEPWTRLFNSLRSSRETELVERLPVHKVCAWLGNSPQVAHKHYLLLTDDDFAAEAGLQSDVTKNVSNTRRYGPSPINSAKPENESSPRNNGL